MRIFNLECYSQSKVKYSVIYQREGELFSIRVFSCFVLDFSSYYYYFNILLVIVHILLQIKINPVKMRLSISIQWSCWIRNRNTPISCYKQWRKHKNFKYYGWNHAHSTQKTGMVSKFIQFKPTSNRRGANSCCRGFARATWSNVVNCSHTETESGPAGKGQWNRRDIRVRDIVDKFENKWFVVWFLLNQIMVNASVVRQNGTPWNVHARAVTVCYFYIVRWGWNA